MVARFNITVDDEIGKLIEKHRQYINVSKVCGQALKTFCENLERALKTEHFTSLEKRVEELEKELAKQKSEKT